MVAVKRAAAASHQSSKAYEGHHNHVHADEDLVADAADVEDYLREKANRQSNLVRKLPFSLTFFVIYAVAALDHEHTADSWSLQTLLRDKIEGTKFDGVDFTSGHKTLYELDNEGDFYLYLKEAFIPQFINELSVSQADRYRVLRYNQIIGGVQLQQVRRATRKCSTEYPDLGPFPEAGRTNPVLADFRCFPWYTESDECYGPGLTNRTVGFCPDSMPAAPRAKVPGTSGRRLAYVPDASGKGSDSKGTSEDQEVYSVYLYEHEGQAKALEKVDELEAQGWIDLNTAWVGANMLIFNPQLAIFVHTTVHVYFPPSGALLSYFTAQSFVSEPYQAGSNALMLDIFFLLLLLWHTLELLRKIYTASKQDSMIKLAFNMWTWLHVALVVGGFFIVICWLMLLDHIVAGKNRVLDVKASQPDVSFMSDSYPDLVVALHEQMTVISDFLALFRMYLGMFMLLVACACLEAFAAQPRLAILTETIYAAGTDLFHFMVVLSIVFLSYVISGMFLFGRRVWEFSKITRAIPTCFLMLFGDFDWDTLKAEHPVTAGFWFWSFMVMAVLVLLNMLMAIIMDKYSAVKAEVLDSPTIWDQGKDMVQDQLNSKLGKKLSLHQTLQRVEDLDGSLDKDSLREQVKGLTKAQAEDLMDATVNRMEAQVEKGMTMSKAMQMIGWVSIHVQKLNWALGTIVEEEREQMRIMNHEPPDHDLDQPPPPPEADGYIEGDGVGGAYVAEVGEHLEDLELRMQRLENFMSEAVDFAGVRGKDLGNRLQVIEHLLRGQRDAALSAPTNVWEQEPPKLDVSV